MSRAARRRAEREAKKVGGTVEAGKHQLIQLKNPVSDFYETFIFGNSLVCEHVVEPGSHVGKRVVICGAGPSLAEEAEEWCRKGDELWGANSALPWLIEHGYEPTHGVTVDQTAAMVNEWWSAPDVEYLLASTVHPHLTDHLLNRGRRVRWFHNFVGISKPHVEYCACGHDHGIEHVDGMDRRIATCVDAENCECDEYRPRFMSYEDWLYASLYPPTLRAGSGLNTVTRAVDLALAMGAEVVVLGADCALRVKRPLPAGTKIGSAAHRSWLENETTMHADGGNALASGATPVTIGGEIDGVWWETKPDMAISAQFLLAMEEANPDRLKIVGNTLPNALKGQSDDFLARLPALLDSRGNPIPIVIQDTAVLTGPDVAT